MIFSIDIEKFNEWLTRQGVEILPNTNEHEAIRFKGREVGILYKSGKVSNRYALSAIECFRNNKSWNGRPISTGRNNSYRWQKRTILERDGADCFLCGEPMGEDITLEHLVSLSSGGQNTLANMALCHEKCNIELGNLPLAQKVKRAIHYRVKNVKKLQS